MRVVSLMITKDNKTDYYSRIKKLMGGDSSDIPGVNSAGHPSNWDNDQYRVFAERWINELARMAQWRDGKGCPRFDSDPARVEKLAGIPEDVLKDCVRYRVSVYDIDFWLRLTPEKRYQQAKKEWSTHECSVHRRHGHTHASTDKPGCSAEGCIEECIYYPDTGTIDDETVLSWYRDTIGDRTYEQLKKDNNAFVTEFADMLKDKASKLPQNIPYQKDYFESYYPSIMDF